MGTILIVDDDQDLRYNVGRIIQEEGYATKEAANGKAAIEAVKRWAPILVLLDIRLPDKDGVQVLEELRGIDANLAVIMLTAYGEIKDVVRTMKLGAVDYLTKPFDNEELRLVIKRALEVRSLSQEVVRLRERLGERANLEEEIGQSERIRTVLSQVETIAATKMTVVVQGESGTGKELIARMIHQRSPRRNKAFVAIDCGAIPDTLAESELFGYEKGAFTGADGRREGKFELADGGTLFLDEVTNLSPAAQAKLLRVLQERKVQRLGGRREIEVDVRIVVACNQNITKVVREGGFRSDLFFRLNEFCIELPPLRERKEDIPPLVTCFLKEVNQELDKKIREVSTQARERLMEYQWPGNVRELRNVVRKAALLATDGIIRPKDIFLSMEEDAKETNALKSVIGQGGFEQAVKGVEKELIEQALEQAGHNKTKAARLLRIDRKALYRKMALFGFGCNAGSGSAL